MDRIEFTFGNNFVFMNNFVTTFDQNKQTLTVNIFKKKRNEILFL